MNKTTAIIAITIALIIGLGLGFLLFGNQNTGFSEGHNHASKSEAATTSSEEWSCSMHPQIRQNEFGICPICEMDLTPISNNSSSDPLVLEMTEEAVKISNIQTTKIGGSEASEAEDGLKLIGKIQADERLAVSQVTHISGRIEQLFVTFTGEQITKGQKLATIYSSDLIAAQGELLEAMKLKEISPNLLEATRNKLRYLKFSEEDITAIEERGTIQENFAIYADASGIVTQKRVKVGDHLKQGEPLFDLINLNRVWVIFDAYEDDLSKVKIGDNIQFNVPAIPNQKFTTKITFIDPIINPKTRVAGIRGEVKNTRKTLKPEMLVTGILKGKTVAKNTMLTVPKSAVLWTGKRSVVYVRLPDMDIPSFQFREVELGQSVGSNYQVVSGLKLGDEVVTYGNFTIDAAAQLNNQASMMNRNVKVKKEKVIEKTPDFIAETPQAFKKKLEQLTLKYLDTKDALVLTDASKTTEVSKVLIKTLESTKIKLKNQQAQDYWQQQYDIMQTHGKMLLEKTEVEAQRRQFGFFSAALINSLQAFGAAESEFYIQHCPMAFDNEGGDWISLEEGIRNPYFGDKMMKCGLVKAVVGR